MLHRRAQALQDLRQILFEKKDELVKVHKENESRVGKDLIQSIYKETGFDPKKL